MRKNPSEETSRAFFNVRNFMRSLSLQIATKDNPPWQEELDTMVLDSIQELRTY